MSIGRRIGSLSKEAWLVAIFLALAFLLGGGEAKGPQTELLLQLAFAALAVAWVWQTKTRGAEQRSIHWLVILIALLVLIVPLVQLIPLPPSIWQSFPGRESQIAALRLVGAQDTWRPISEVPLRTVQTLLSLVPAAGLLIAVSRLDLQERRVVPITILAMAILTVLIGAAQLASPAGSLNFYSKIHAGWLTGFQSNRNHAAEVLLAGLAALACLSKLLLSPGSMRLPRDFNRRSYRILAAGLALLLLAAIAMTGSRTGIALAVVVAAGSMIMFGVPSGTGRVPRGALAATAGLILAFAGLSYLLLQGGDTAIGRVADRFTMVEDNREKVWADAMFALRQYWPVGIGAGGFIAAMFPAERLEFLDASYPNQAHNDFLEIGIEGGIFAYVVLGLVLLCVAIMALRSFISGGWESRVQILFGALVLITLSLHSVVDYPLRSMSLSCLAAAACGLLSTAAAKSDQRKARKTVKGH